MLITNPLSSSTRDQNLLPAQQQLGNGMELHIGRAFVYFAYLGVAIEFFYRIILGKSVAAVNLHRQGSHALRHLGRVQLGHSSFFDETNSPVFHPRAVLPHHTPPLTSVRHLP